MVPTYILLIQCLLAISYVCLILQPASVLRRVTVAIFCLLALSLRYLVDVDAVLDFSSYFANFTEVKYGTGPGGSFAEPYMLIVYRLALLCIKADDFAQIKCIYYVHFLVVTGFFVWLAVRRDITFESKLVLFLSFYPWMAFVGLRAGMAYTASCFLFLAVTNPRLEVVQWLIPLIHASSLPYVVAMKATALKAVGRLILVSMVVALGYSVTLADSHFVKHILGKLDRYSETASERTSVNLLLFHIANISFLSYLALINSRFRTNPAVLSLSVAYVLAYFLNPVVGIRLFPFILISSITQRITFPCHQLLTLVICLVYLPVFIARFDQCVLWW